MLLHNFGTSLSVDCLYLHTNNTNGNVVEAWHVSFLSSNNGHLLFIDKWSVIRQKGKSKFGASKTKHVKYPEKQTFLTPLYTHLRVWSGLNWNVKVSAFKNFNFVETKRELCIIC